MNPEHPAYIESLVKMKEELKNEVMNPTLKWQERIDLYQRIQELNQQINSLNNHKTLLPH